MFSSALAPVLRLALLSVLVLLSACASRAPRPDLARLYADVAGDPIQPPVIVIHGLMGSTLVDPGSGEEYWPGGFTRMAVSDYRELALLGDDGADTGRALVPGRLLTEIGGVDFYGELLRVLRQAGRYQRGVPGTPVGDQRRRYYIFLYDWRRDNVASVRQLHALIEQIRRDYADPRLKVDIVAHSNGGLIANYYLRFGPEDVLGQDKPVVWAEGSQRVRRLVLLGTPNLGSVSSLRRFVEGFRLGLRLVPPELLAGFATPFQALPHPWASVVLGPDGHAVSLDIFDPELWQRNQWSVYAPEVIARLRENASSAEQGEQYVAEVQQSFARKLRRAKQFQLALTAAFPRDGLRIAAFGGDCEMTLSHALLENRASGARLVFDADELEQRDPALDYDQLLLAGGDGLVTRDSQDAHEFGFVPLHQSFFLCEEHTMLTANPYFQNNLLNFLLR